MSERGYWNRAGRRSGGDRTPTITVPRIVEDGRLKLIPDEPFVKLLLDYSDAKQEVFECQCEQGHCEHVTAMRDIALDIADRLVVDPSPRPTTNG